MRYGELWLRGKNRSDYINILLGNMEVKFSGLKYRVDKHYDKIIIRPSESSFDEALRRIGFLFGVGTYEVAYETEPNLSSIVKDTCRIMKNAEGRGAFRINAHRAYKQHKFNSEDIVRKLAAAAEKKGIPLSPKKYSREVYISVAKDFAYISVKRFKGLGGLPVGSSGRCIVLFSGGIDSPVAAWLAMKRGMEPVYVHMHAFPKASEALESKIANLIEILAEYHEAYRTYYIPTHRFQVAALKTGRYELVMLKRFMLKCAEQLLEREKSMVIVTGESIGQVASQTQNNLFAEEQDIKAAVIRPLACFDKTDIIEIARRIGTFDESVKPYRDVCSIYAKHPVINSDPKAVIRIEKEIKLDFLVAAAIKSAEIADGSIC
ncbi:MAG: tRNA 4-thiouridine(8) synthase ThiI [Candidatus Marsarchaeota archaeon]|nr:tRNA 4-thiouridine(8) synthase ThiI [Candidatus Marsarchaeota archaeon]